MNWNFEIPALVALKMTMSASLQKMWKNAVWTVKQGQDKFLRAYTATIDEQIPEWRERWKADPDFPAKLTEIEEYIKAICRRNGMPATTFNRYRTAARKALLMGTPFRFAAQNFTVAEARAIAEGGEGVAKRLRAGKNLHHATTVVSRHATIIPVPEDGVNPEDYLEMVSGRLSECLRLIRERLGSEIHDRLVENLMGTARGGQERADHGQTMQTETKRQALGNKNSAVQEGANHDQD
jgi:hypothetical protein